MWSHIGSICLLLLPSTVSSHSQVPSRRTMRVLAFTSLSCMAATFFFSSSVVVSLIVKTSVATVCSVVSFYSFLRTDFRDKVVGRHCHYLHVEGGSGWTRGLAFKNTLTLMSGVQSFTSSKEHPFTPSNSFKT